MAQTHQLQSPSGSDEADVLLRPRSAQLGSSVSSASTLRDSDDVSPGPTTPDRTNGLKHPRQSLLQYYQQWWLELVGAAASIVLMIGVILFLARVDGSRLDDWQNEWQLTPATIVSILVTACRLTLAFTLAQGLGQLKWVFFEQGFQTLSAFGHFDGATRGPWGALLFLWQMKGRAIVASFGAALAILVLAADPFSQQVFSYTTRDILLPGANATIGASKYYNSGAITESIPTGLGPSSGQTSSALTEQENARSATSDENECADTLMARAAYGGLFSTDNAAKYSCLSGNCTWPVFTTLSICGQCTDITSSIHFDCTHKEGSSNCQLEIPGQGYPAAQGKPGWSPRQFLSSCARGKSSGPLWRSEFASDISVGSEILNFNTYRFPTGYLEGGSCRLPTPDTRSCSLSWCGRTYSAVTVRNGELIEEQSTLSTLVPLKSFNNSCPSLDGVSPPGDDTQIKWLGLVNANVGCPRTVGDVQSGDVFWVNEVDHNMTRSLLSGMVAGKEINTDMTGGAYSSSGGPADVALLTAMFDKNAGNLEATVSDIAASMSNRVRAGPGAGSIHGVGTTTITVVMVNWYRLIYLELMVVLGLAFLFTAMAFSAEKSQLIWKSSSLAVLFHGLDGFQAADLDGRTLEDMEKRADELEAKLELNDRGALKLVR